MPVDSVAHEAAVKDVADDDADAAGEVAELHRVADQGGHGVTPLERAPGEQPPGAAGRSYDEDVHARIVPTRHISARTRGRRGPGGVAAARRAGPATAPAKRSQRRRRLWAAARQPRARAG